MKLDFKKVLCVLALTVTAGSAQAAGLACFEDAAEACVDYSNAKIAYNVKVDYKAGKKAIQRANNAKNLAFREAVQEIRDAAKDRCVPTDNQLEYHCPIEVRRAVGRR